MVHGVTSYTGACDVGLCYDSCPWLMPHVTSAGWYWGLTWRKQQWGFPPPFQWRLLQASKDVTVLLWVNQALGCSLWNMCLPEAVRCSQADLLQWHTSSGLLGGWFSFDSPLVDFWFTLQICQTVLCLEVLLPYFTASLDAHGFPDSSVGKESAYNAEDPGSIPGLEGFPLEKGQATHCSILGFPGGSAGKEFACNVGDLGSIPGLGRCPGDGNSYPLQYSGLENSTDHIDHRVAKSRTRLSELYFLFSLPWRPAAAVSLGRERETLNLFSRQKNAG